MIASAIAITPSIARAEPPFAEPPPGEPYPTLPPAAASPAPVAQAAKPASWSVPRPPKPEPESSVVNLITVDVGGMYARGTKLVGYGTRAPYQGIVGTGHIGGAYFPIPHFGFDLHLRGLLASTRVTAISVGMDGTVDAAIPWRGALRGALVLGAGGGFQAGNKGWVDEEGRAFPIAMMRLRLVPAQMRMAQIEYRVAPVSASKVTLQMHHIEASGSVSYLRFGARVDLSVAQGGDPRRTFRENAFGIFIGAGWF